MASTPSHRTQNSHRGLPSLVSSSRLGDILGGSNVLHEALIVELIGVRELYRRSLISTLPVPHAQLGWRIGAESRITLASKGKQG